MGKGPRGGQERTIRGYEGPVWDANTLLARNAGNLMYGGDTSGPANFAASQTPTQPAQGPSDDAHFQQVMQDLIGGRPLNTETMRAIEPQLAQYGLRFEWNADGTRPDLMLPDGRQIDFVTNMGDPTKSQEFTWQVMGSPQTGGGIYGGGHPAQGGNFGGGIPGLQIGDYGNLMSGFGEFAQTGGYSPEELANIRARAVSPIRSAYSSARREVDRQRSLQGGYSPNRSAVLSKMAREQSQATSDASTNAEAAIAQMVNQGRRFGLSGGSSLFGTSPGMASTFGSQALQGQQLQNQAAQNMIQNRAQSQMMPGAFETTMGRIGQIGGMALPAVTGGAQFTNPFANRGANNAAA